MKAIIVAALIVHNSNGGVIGDFYNRLENASSIRISGYCASACTLYLAHKAVCIKPGTRFGFHKPHGASHRVLAVYEKAMMRLYPQWVRNWIAAKGGLRKQIIWMPYEYAKQFVRGCNGSKRV